MKVGIPIADIVAGMWAAHGALAALFARERTGKGQKVDIAMLDGQVALLTYQAGIFFATGKSPPRLGNAHASIVPYETFACSDGSINIAVGNETLWERFCEVIERPDLVHQPRFETNAKRVEHHAELKALLDPILARRPCQVWLDRLGEKGIPCGRIYELSDVLTHPQVLAREMVVDVEHPVAGRTRLTGVPIKLSETPGRVHSPPPTLGQHTQEVLSQLLGKTPQEIAALRDEGVV
jgi:crotonobetainyl-CoA:carnitine CoA-transferase CaiB-like acyl-CoA transferase